jgi:type II restriction/modification system DNA methylase subunit YeeA
MGAGRFFVSVTPAQLYGIEINEYAHELAQMTIQIGYIQWLRDNGYGQPAEPILKPMKNILHMDAILTPSPASPKYDSGGSVDNQNKNVVFGGLRSVPEAKRAVGAPAGAVGAEPAWPAVDVIIGNPPFLGGNKIRAELGDQYVNNLFKLYEGRVPAFADLVCYWFEKAREMIEKGEAKRAGLLATQGIRGGANRKVLERIKRTGDIFWAQSDRNWVLNGATVHVSMIAFDAGNEKEKYLDDQQVLEINSDLTSAINATQALTLIENAGIGFRGNQKGGAFDITAQQANEMLSASSNPNGRPNSDVVHRWVNGSDITGLDRNMWLIDFGINMPLEQAAGYEKPFKYIKEHVGKKYAHVKSHWWLHERPRPELRAAISKLQRFIVTPHVSKHRIFVWVKSGTIPDHQLIVFVRSDDYFFGVVHSRLHEVWARATGTQLREAESGFRYTPSTCFETFPFPWPPGEEPKDDPRVQAIAQAAKELVEQRDRWLTPTLPPPNTTLESLDADSKITPSYLGEVSEGRRGSKRTLTNLYNARPTWLDLAHKRLDDAVFAAYGWPSDLSDEEILERLLALNLEKSNNA